MRRFVAAVLAGAFLDAAHAILVTPASPCSVSCGNVLDSTTPADVQCDENAYASTSSGVVFSNCVRCELGSNFQRAGQTDLDAMLCES